MEGVMNSSTIWSSFDDFLTEVGIYDEVMDCAF